MLHRYLAAADSAEPAERDFRKSFENAVRGYYSLEGDQEEGRIGPLLKDGGSAATAAYSRELFKGSVTDPLPASAEPSRAPSLSPL